MSCQKLSRKFLHLVSRHGHDLYSISQLDVSSLFYPSAAAAETLTTKRKAAINELGVVGSIGRLRGPSVYYRPYKCVVPNPYSLLGFFAPFGESKNKILCSDDSGNSSIYNTEMNSFMSLPRMNSPKRLPCTVAVCTPCPATGSMSKDNLYILDMNLCSFEVLSYNPVDRWSWRLLPSPPFFDAPEYNAPTNAPTAVLDGTKVCVSTTTATYSFDTATCVWRKLGDWVLPFKAQHVSELGLWLGLTKCEPFELCAFEGLSTATGCSPPTVQRVGSGFDPPEDWSLLNHTLVNVGPNKFCIANVFDVITDHDRYETFEVTVFTGVEVSRGESSVLRMIRHKTKCFTNFIEHVF